VSAPPPAFEPFDPFEWPIAWMALAERQHARNATALLAPLGLHHREFRLLAFLGRQDGLSVGELAEAAVLERSTVSKMLDRLEAEGWVERHGHPDDARRATLGLTAEGQSRLHAARPIVQSLFQRYQAGTTPAEHEGFMQALRQYFERVQAARADAQTPAGRPRRRGA
jgi:DNA-binding MarR family transcriptional regulator